MIEINLVPDVKQELIRARMVRSAVITGSIFTMIVAAAVVVLLVVYIFGVQSVRSVVADAAIKKGSEQLASVQDLSKVLTIQNQLTKISGYEDQKKVDSRVFDMLSAIIPPAPNSVQVSTLTVDADTSSIKIEGQTPTYPALETFKKTVVAANVRYQDESNNQVDVPLAKDISLSDVSYGEDANGNKVLRFTMTFTYADELFSPKVANPTIVLVNGGNVTDSYVGIPKSIFVDRATDAGSN